MIKRLLASLLVVVMFLTAMPFNCFGIKTTAATNGKTQAQAVAYMDGFLGSTVGSGQCPALAKEYYAYLGYSVSGDGKDYYYNVPDGWTRIEYTSGVVAQPGDIAVWKATNSTLGAVYGHVAVVASGDLSKMTIYEQGESCNYKVKKNTITYGQYGQLTCLIRPDFVHYTTIPDPVLNLHSEKNVYNSSEYINFSWESANGAQGYWLHMWKDGAEIYSLDSNSTSFTSAPTSPGKYTLCIRPYNSAGINEHSKAYDFIVTDTVPEPVTNLRSDKKVYTTSEYIYFTWDEAYGAQNYWIYMWQDGTQIYSCDCGYNTSFTAAPSVEGSYTLCIRPGNINGFNEHSKGYSFVVNNGYSVTYQSDLETSIPDAQTKTHDSNLILCSDIPVLANYNFKEWNTKPDGTGVSYQPGDIYSENADLTLYAIWELDHEHQYISEITQQPTCTEKGIKAFTCSLCNDVYYEDIDELGHDYIGRVTEPTCTSQGFTTYECSRCDDSYTENYIDSFNHSSSSWHTAINPTATSEGLAEKLCDYCGIVLDQFTIPCLAPDYVTGITLSSEKETVKIGDTFTLSATVIPDTAKNKNVIWSSRNPEIVSVNNGKVTAIKPGTTAIVAETEDGGYIDFCLVRVISLVAFNGAVIDNDRNIIYGLSSNLESVDDYLKTADDSMTVNLSTSTVGTGTFINVMDNGEVVDLYEAVIFGDVNGDSWYDGQDAVLVSCLANGMLTKEDVGEAVYTAADCNHDGIIDQIDVDLLNHAGALLAKVDQSKPIEVLLETSSEYVEYLDLIDQSPEIEIEDETDVPEVDVETEDTTPEQGKTEFDIFEMIMNVFKLILEMLIAYVPILLK